MIVNGVKLEDLDIFDLEVSEKVDKELKKVDEAAKTLEGLVMPDIIRTQCNAIFDLFNNLFGEGTDKKIFGEKVNLVTCLKALDDFVSEMRKRNKEIESISNKYSPNRVARRAKK